MAGLISTPPITPCPPCSSEKETQSRWFTWGELQVWMLQCKREEQRKKTLNLWKRQGLAVRKSGEGEQQLCLIT